MPEEPKVEKPEMVTIPKEQLQRILDTVERQGKDMEVLFKVADKNSLAKLREQDGVDSLVKTCKVWKWKNGKYVIATRLVSNIAEVVNGRYFEDQVLEVIFDDSTSEKTSYLDFARHKVLIVAEIIDRKPGKNVRGDDSAILDVQLKDGKTFKVAQEFIN